jgi:hypothetical protein
MGERVPGEADLKVSICGPNIEIARAPDNFTRSLKPDDKTEVVRSTLHIANVRLKFIESKLDGHLGDEIAKNAGICDGLQLGGVFKPNRIESDRSISEDWTLVFWVDPKQAVHARILQSLRSLEREVPTRLISIWKSTNR